MKKIIASAVGLALVGGVAVTTASAVESQFGGYWRTRMFVQSDFDGQDSADFNRTDNRTRLYYTAKFNDDFKFVNKFEFNTNWGSDSGGGVGSDGRDSWRIKNSYADFTLGNVRTTVGQQGAVISRGFIFDDDFSGAVVRATFGDVTVPVLYSMNVDDDVRATDTQLAGEGGDEHFVSVMPSFQLDNIKLTPHVSYLNGTSDLDRDMAWLGLDVDAKFDAFSAWGTFIYNTGEVGASDIDGYLLAAGAEAGIVHGQAFYASGDDGDADGDLDTFVGAPGQSYYWSEIMGLGVFDNRGSAGSPENKISNIMAVNLGVTLKPMDKLKLDFDIWYAALAEDNLNGDDALGVEFDAKATYALMDDLNAEFIVAYLMADDATAVVDAVGDPKNDEDVLEAGVRLSLKF